jgi:hypothetical protein
MIQEGDHNLIVYNLFQEGHVNMIQEETTT